jgi:hypothetical protein
MRAKEFLREETVVDIQMREIAETFSNESARIIFEEADSKDIVDFLSRAEVISPLTSTDIGKTFFPVNLIVVPPNKYISVAKFSNDATLLQITAENHYIFKCGNKKQTFPEVKENSLIYRLVFPSKKEYEQFEMLLLVQFGTWTIRSKML